MNKRDSSRLEQFRQLKKEIRGSKEYLIIGIDVAKDRHHAFFGTARGKTLLKRLVFENTREGFDKLLLQTEAVKLQHGLTKTIFGLEPTANYHKPLGQFLIKGDHMVVLVSGMAVKRNRELLDGRWDKLSAGRACYAILLIAITNIPDVLLDSSYYALAQVILIIFRG